MLEEAKVLRGVRQGATESEEPEPRPSGSGQVVTALLADLASCGLDTGSSTFLVLDGAKALAARWESRGWISINRRCNGSNGSIGWPPGCMVAITDGWQLLL